MLLTDEEISRALRNQGYTDEVHAELEVVAKAQLKKVVEFGSKPIFGQVGNLGQCATVIVHIPVDEYDALLEEVE